MLLSELFEQLTHGELSQLDKATNEGLGITPESYPFIVAHVNMALTSLYKIFPLRMQEAIIQQEESIATYFLAKKFAVNGGSNEPIKYLLDTVNAPFVDNVLRIDEVVNEAGDTILLNDVMEPTSIHTPNYNSILVPDPVQGELLSVLYRADHDPILVEGLIPNTYDLGIPNTLMEPLLFYIAFRAYASSPPIDGVSQSIGFLNKFEASIKRIKDLDLINEDEQPNRKFSDRGWV